VGRDVHVEILVVVVLVVGGVSDQYLPLPEWFEGTEICG
jgi:hypothetical protein